MTIPSDLPRRTFTVRDVELMVEAGIITEDERVELIFGELIPMNPKGIRHETLKMLIMLRFARVRPPHALFIPETTFHLSPDTYIEPDFVVFPKAAGVTGLTAASALLAIEIADSSLSFDLGTKAAIYAHFNVRELWVIDADRDRIHVHRAPDNGRYTSIAAFGAKDLVTPTFAPAEFALMLAELDAEAG